MLLSRPGEDFTGGAFVLTEQRPRMQSRVEAVELRQGEAVIVPVQQRPVAGGHRPGRVMVRRGVSRVQRGAGTRWGLFSTARRKAGWRL